MFAGLPLPLPPPPHVAVPADRNRWINAISSLSALFNRQNRTVSRIRRSIALYTCVYLNARHYYVVKLEFNGSSFLVASS